MEEDKNREIHFKGNEHLNESLKFKQKQHILNLIDFIDNRFLNLNNEEINETLRILNKKWKFKQI